MDLMMCVDVKNKKKLKKYYFNYIFTIENTFASITITEHKLASINTLLSHDQLHPKLTKP
jgi:hypothetical protein